VLFAAEERDDALDEVEDELFRFGRILDREPPAPARLTDPSLPADRKQSLLDALLANKVRRPPGCSIGEVVLRPAGAPSTGRWRSTGGWQPPGASGSSPGAQRRAADRGAARALAERCGRARPPGALNVEIDP
jgi:hypothetical protein